MTSKLDFIIRKAVIEDKVNVQNFLVKNFFGQSPLHEAFHMYDHPTPEKFVTYADDNRDFTLQAIDLHNNLIGVATTEQHAPSWRDPLTSENSKNYIGVLEFAKKKAEIDNFVDATELYILSVSPEGRNKGVGKRLVEESMKIARESGFKTMYIKCVSEFSARIAKSLGWREHYRLLYNDYGKLSGTGVVVNTPPPHKHLIYYVTDL